MRIALINGSPKVKGSASGSLLAMVKDLLGGKAEIEEISLHTAVLSEKEMDMLQKMDVWVFAFPLYVDGVPSHLLAQMVNMEKNQIGNGRASVYGIVNCGFYEGIQAEYALDIMKNWCIKAGLMWKSGIGVGGGGGLAYMPTGENGPAAPIYRDFALLVDEILQNKEHENRYVSIAFPRALYKMGAQTGWRQMIKKNGLKSRNLGDRPEAAKGV